MAEAVEKFGDLNVEQLTKGLTAAGVAMLEIAAFMKIINISLGNCFL